MRLRSLSEATAVSTQNSTHDWPVTPEEKWSSSVCCTCYLWISANLNVPTFVFSYTHIFEHLYALWQTAELVSGHILRRYSIPLVLLGGLHICVVTRLDPPKPARLPSRFLASSRHWTRGCTALQVLWAESWGSYSRRWTKTLIIVWQGSFQVLKVLLMLTFSFQINI